MGGMKVSELDFVRLLPAFMQDDEAAIALSKAMNQLIGVPGKRLKTLSVWDNVDNLNEAECDELAWELNVDWYDHFYPLEVKRDILKNSIKVHANMGTKYAIEKALGSLYPGAKVVEWFEYDGKPHTFRIIVNITDEPIRKAEQLISMISIYKRSSAHLDIIRYVFHDEVNQKIRYELAMTFAGAFWPRSNLPLHLLDGTTRLDGRYPLSGYLSGQSLDFYPLALRVTGTAFWRPVSAGGDAAVQALLWFQSRVQQPVYHGMNFGARGTAELAMRPAGRLYLSGAAGAKPAAEAKTAVRGEVTEDVGYEAALCIRGEGNARATPAGGMQVSAGAGEAGRTAAAGYLRIEKNWGMLDGSCRLDGSRELDAVAYEVEV